MSSLHLKSNKELEGTIMNRTQNSLNYELLAEGPGVARGKKFRCF